MKSSRSKVSCWLLGLLALALFPISVTEADSLIWQPTRKLLGKSVNGKPIYGFQIGDPNATRTVVVLGQMHGDEPAGPKTARALLRRTAPIAGVSFWVIPTVNPDGAARGTRKNARGVDLNRNWSHRWAKVARSSRYYGGPKPFSEPESRALRAFLRKHNPKWLVSIHQPLNAIDPSEKSPKLSRRLHRYLGLPLKSLNCSGVCHGTMTSWINNRMAGSAVTVEFQPNPSKYFIYRKAPDGIRKTLVTP